MGRNRVVVVGTVVAAIAIAVALVAGTAQAISWEEWAPAPLGSDSSYAALQARTVDSLSAAEVQWLAVQRDWRTQRDMEARWSGSSQLSREWKHRARRTDGRFAELASRPYAALTNDERAWLVTENAAQRADQLTPRVGINPLGLVLTGAIVGLVAVIAALRRSWP